MCASYLRVRKDLSQDSVAHLSRSITRLGENIARIGGDRAQHMGCQVLGGFGVLVVLVEVLRVRVEPSSKL